MTEKERELLKRLLEENRKPLGGGTFSLALKDEDIAKIVEISERLAMTPIKPKVGK
jgi:hypothetical protein